MELSDRYDRSVGLFDKQFHLFYQILEETRIKAQLFGRDSLTAAQLELIESSSYILEKREHKRADFCDKMLGLKRQVSSLYIEWESSLDLLVSSFEC